MMIKESYDLIIVGAGPSGTTAALYAEHFGLDFLLIDRCQFPRDKVCGDGLTSIIFSILEEISLEMEIDETFFNTSGFRIMFSEGDERDSRVFEHGSERLLYNCKRQDFDHKLFSLLKNRERFLQAKLQSVNGNEQEISLEVGEQLVKIQYRWLILATGSGKNVLDKAGTISRTIYASRAYVRSDSGQSENLMDFFDNVSPGYFWAFPVGNGIFNTGVLFHTPPGETDVHVMHKLKLQEHFMGFEILSHTRFPLRVYSPGTEEPVSNIMAIGDANHSVDPLFGHGIDTGMLEAREQVISLHKHGRFTASSNILKLIRDKNEFSEKCRIDLSAPIAPKDKMQLLLNTLHDLDNHYQKVAQTLSEDFPRNSSVPDKERISTHHHGHVIGFQRLTLICHQLFSKLGTRNTSDSI